MKNTPKIDKFYFAMGAVFLLLSILAVFSIRTIFDGINKANSIDQESLQGNILRIDKAKLDEASKKLEDKSFIPLDLR
jgi:hypothetical protein